MQGRYDPDRWAVRVRPSCLEPVRGPPFCRNRPMSAHHQRRGVDLNLEVCWHSESLAGMVSGVWEFSEIGELWTRSLSLMDNMDNQWGLLWAEPVEGKRKVEFLKMECIRSATVLFCFFLRVLMASGSSERLERSAHFTSLGSCRF